MPARWQASQRPMYVRTVWVGGFRHAILSHDDPYFISQPRTRRPHSSATCASKQTTRTRNPRRESYDLEDCFKKINFVIKSEPAIKQRPNSSQPDVESLDLTNVEQSEDDFVIKASQQPIYEFGSSRTRFDGIYLSMRTSKSQRTARSEIKENTELSERVLQWLDLAGKVDLLAPDNVERMSQPRHSWPGIQRHQLTKSKTAADVRKEIISTPKVDSARAQNRNEPIDRQDFYVPAAANTIENYARQSRHQNTPRQETNTKLKENKTKSKDLQTNIMETRKKIALERTAMEKKYAELISKKLIPDLKGNKKQVHIFMPEMPKKSSICNSNSRAESLLSQLSQFSQVSKK